MTHARDRRLAKTNAVREVERSGVIYALRSYPVTDEHASAAEVAERVGLPIEQVFKTLVARGDRTGPLFAVVPAHRRLDLKALARASANRRAELVPLREVTMLTGYVRGATTVFASKKALPVFVDDSAECHETITVSAGQRGLQMSLRPADYIRVTAAKVICITSAA